MCADAQGKKTSYENRATPEEVQAILAAGFACDKRDAARILGIHPESLTRLARRGKVPAFQVGDVWRFPTAKIVALVNGES